VTKINKQLKKIFGDTEL